MSDWLANAFPAVQVRALIEGSACYGCTFTQWESRRRFAVRPIDRSGTILDVGCANGFFLRCAQEWCAPLKLIPYGLDIDPRMIAAARRIFPDSTESFQLGNLLTLDSDAFPSTMPPTFDFVYCSLLGPGSVSGETLATAIDRLSGLTKASGRLILGLYKSHIASTSRTQDLSIDTRACEIATFSTAFKLSKNPYGDEQAVLWIDRKDID